MRVSCAAGTADVAAAAAGVAAWGRVRVDCLGGEVEGLRFMGQYGMIGMSDQDTDSGFFVCLISYPACRQTVGMHPASVKPLVCLWSDTDAYRPFVVP